ncbi:MAG: hypothetical protein ABIP21_04430 [Acidimicrobiia bacterium]
MNRPAVMLASLLAMVASFGCQSRAKFDVHPIADIESALRDRGLAVCSTLDNSKGLANQAASTRVLNVAIDCHEEIVPVVVDRFHDAPDRDAAARNFESLNRPRGHGVVWTWANFTISAFGPRDDRVIDRVTAAMDRLGAT